MACLALTWIGCSIDETSAKNSKEDGALVIAKALQKNPTMENIFLKPNSAEPCMLSILQLAVSAQQAPAASLRWSPVFQPKYQFPSLWYYFPIPEFFANYLCKK